MTELEKAAREELACSYMKLDKSAFAYDGCAMLNMFYKGAEWQSKQSPWIDINDSSVIMPNDKECLLRLEDGTIVRDTEDWEDEHICFVTHWMPIPSFDNILEANKDVLQRIKEKGD